jgi:hypothetical protein
MKKYRLNYLDRQTAIADLILKYIIDENEEYILGTVAVTHIGKVVSENATYDENGNETSPTKYKKGYYVDIMLDREIIFDINILVLEQNHRFA